ncbi:MAG TPA: sugar phosphate isomerase/epimerase [Anaerolineae bacterium]|nr:sugar phosphate isomerase/epimerase [Anaerolineae bacterium]HOQ97543.1 sugar phosphate isomerase/epimerase [Anaerolineae bacterium]HPL28373.1 sugar phosphate isomerase/epimerase [Anaerolineae bacterium]
MFQGIAINADDNAIDGDFNALARLLDRAAAVGFDGVEISAGCCNAVRGRRLVSSEVERARALLARYPLRYTLHGPDSLNLARDPEPAAEVLESCLQLAAGLGAEVLVYHSGQIALHDAWMGLAPLPDEQALADLWPRETEALQRMARRAEALGVLIAVENRDPHLWEVAALARYGRPATDLVRYHQGMRLDLLCAQMAQVASPSVGLCLDVGHAFLAAPYWPEPDYLAAVRAAAPWVRHLHLHDNFGRLDDIAASMHERLIFGQADNHMPAGWGRIPLRQVLEALTEAGYSGWVLAEVAPRYEPYYEEALANVRALLPGACL